MRLTGLEGTVADLYDVTDPAAPRVAAALPAPGGALSLSVAAGPARELLAVTSAGYLAAQSLSVVREPDLRAAGRGADYLLIAHDSLLKAARPLADLRAAQKLKVAVVPVSAVYNQFSGGVFTPQALADFLAYTLAKWQPRPRYLLLVGDATHDYRDYRGTGFHNLVPAMMVREAASIEVAADVTYAVGEDGRLQLAVGRLPARTPAEAATLVWHLLDFEKGAAAERPRRLLLMADQEGFGGESERFTRSCEQWAARALAAGFAVDRFYQTGVGLREQDPKDTRLGRTRAELTQKLVAALAAGATAVLYQGHGDEYFWGYNHLLGVEDLAATLPTRTGLEIEDTCFAGGFRCPGGEEGLSEALLRSGACAACYAPSRLGGQDVQTAPLSRLLGGRRGGWATCRRRCAASACCAGPTASGPGARTSACSATLPCSLAVPEPGAASLARAAPAAYRGRRTASGASSTARMFRSDPAPETRLVAAESNTTTEAYPLAQGVWQSALACSPVAELLTSSVCPVPRSCTNTSSQPLVSPVTRFVASEENVTAPPSGVRRGTCDAPLPWVPPVLTLTRLSCPVVRSRTKMSETPLVSPVTRFVAADSKVTKRPSALTQGTYDAPSACSPLPETLIRVVVPAWRSRRKMSQTPLVSPATRLVEVDSKAMQVVLASPAASAAPPFAPDPS